MLTTLIKANWVNVRGCYKTDLFEQTLFIPE